MRAWQVEVGRLGPNRHRLRQPLAILVRDGDRLWPVSVRRGDLKIQSLEIIAQRGLLEIKPELLAVDDYRALYEGFWLAAPAFFFEPPSVTTP